MDASSISQMNKLAFRVLNKYIIHISYQTYSCKKLQMNLNILTMILKHTDVKNYL